MSASIKTLVKEQKKYAVCLFSPWKFYQILTKYIHLWNHGGDVHFHYTMIY